LYEEYNINRTFYLHIHSVHGARKRYADKVLKPQNALSQRYNVTGLTSFRSKVRPFCFSQHRSTNR